MASIQDQFSQIQLALITAQSDLERLNRPDTTIEQLREYEGHLRTILVQLKDITTKSKADRSPNKAMWQRKVRSISDDYYSLKNQFSKMSNNKLDVMKRVDLLSGSNSKKEFDVEAALLKENDSVSRSTAMADYYIEMGKSSMSGLTDQGSLLKGAQRRVLDMANSLGLTGNVIHGSMNRSWWDRVVVYCGIIIISLGLFFVWYYKRK